MFALARKSFANDATSKQIALDGLEPESLFFWTTAYYNGGPGNGRNRLTQYGVDWWKSP